MNIFARAGWQPADPITLKSCCKITSATIFKKCYDKSPVSSLYLWGRKQDLAFQKAVPKKPHQRHHVRFWKTAEEDSEGRPLWVGAATFDKSVGFNKATGQPTHHIEKNVDEERDTLFADLRLTDLLAQDEIMQDFHTVKQGKNGGLDPWETDGHLVIGYMARPRVLGLVSPPAEASEDVTFTPTCWQRCLDHPAFEKLPKNYTSTKRDTKGEPLNVALICTEVQLLAIMDKAGWQRLKKMDRELWDDLYFLGRRHDLAFQIAGQTTRATFVSGNARSWTMMAGRCGSAPLLFIPRWFLLPRPCKLPIAPTRKSIRNATCSLPTWPEPTMLALPSRIEDFHPMDQRHGKTVAGDPWETDGFLIVGLIPTLEE